MESIIDQAAVTDLLKRVEDHRLCAAMARRERGRTDAPDFNLFDFVRDDETGLSRILAWLLDPKGTHGQDDVFLRRFLEHFEIDVGAQPTSDALVRVEAPTVLIAQRRRRIDVRVRIGGFTLAIENKPWAGWQHEQVRAYMRQLKAEAQTGHCLVLFKGEIGELPGTQLTASERRKALAARTLVDSDYLKLHTWAETLAGACHAKRICALLDDFSAHILRTFGDPPVTSNQEDLARSLLDDTSQRRAALHLLSAGEAMMVEIAKRGDEHIAQAVGERWKLGEERLAPDIRWCGHDIILDEKAPFHFKVEFASKQLLDPFYGLWIPNGAPTSAPYPKLRSDLEADGGHTGKLSKHWIWWRDLDDGLFGLRDDADEVAIWEAILSGDFARMTVAAAKRANDDLRKAGILPWGKTKCYRVY